jgi:hypothetical protein
MTSTIHERSTALGASTPGGDQETWAASRARTQKEEKELMGHYFAHHDFLVEEGSDPAAGHRETAASFLVIHGTSPNVVVRESLNWVAEHANKGPFHITWYGPSALVPATVYDFRQHNQHLSAATHVHLFPGTVDLQLQAQVGIEAQRYAEKIGRRFTYTILGAHSFDLETGLVRFHFDREIPIQRTCALLSATQKFLFLDHQKFSGEGEVGYSLGELLATSNAVTMYTVRAENSVEVRTAFDRLASALLTSEPDDCGSRRRKTLTLTLVGRRDGATESIRHHGYLPARDGVAAGGGSASPSGFAEPSSNPVEARSDGRATPGDRP